MNYRRHTVCCDGVREDVAIFWSVSETLVNKFVCFWTEGPKIHRPHTCLKFKKLNHIFVFCHNIHEISISATCQFFPCADFFLSQPTHYVCCCCFTALTLEQEDRTDRHQTDALCFPLWIWPAICLQ